MRKKFLAALLATSLVLTVAPVIPAGTGIAAAEETAATETLTGTKWWDGKQNSKDYTLKGDGTLDLYVGYTGGLDEGAFSVELVSDETKFITTGSDINIWTAGAEGTVEGATEPMAAITKGHKYKVSITRSGNDFTIVYFDMTDNKEHCKLAAKNTNMGNDVSIHVMAQVGTFMVGTSDFEMPADTPEAPGTATTAPDATTAPTTAPDATAAPDTAAGAELDCTGWWTAHTEGTEVTESGVAVSFKNTTYADAADVWNIPVVVAYTGDEAKVNGAGYDEYVVIRGDGYAWTTKGTDANTGAGLEAWNGLGYAFESNAPGDTWVQDNKAGTDCKVQAVISGGKVIIETTVGSVVSKTSFSVEAGKKVYISLSGEKCKLTDIKTAEFTGVGDITGTPTTPAPTTPATGDNDNTDTDNTDTNDTDEPEVTEKKSMKVSGIVAKANTKKVTGKVSVSGAKVKVKVGSAAFKAAKVNGKKFTFTTSKLKKGTKVTIKVTKGGYKAVTKNVKVK